MKFLFLVLAAALIGLSSPAAYAHGYKLGKLELKHPFARATSPNAPVSGGYLTIRNTGDKADRLISGQAGFAARVEIHEMSMDGDVMKMRKLHDGIEIPAGGEVVLEPGGLHVMFMGLEGPLKEGESRAVTLTFENSGSIEVEFSVENVAGMKHDANAEGADEMEHGETDHSHATHDG